MLAEGMRSFAKGRSSRLVVGSGWRGRWRRNDWLSGCGFLPGPAWSELLRLRHRKRLIRMFVRYTETTNNTP